jgi:ABC-type transport system involved in cytochrome bd biosynthesis fused ATPase/permease subunit
MHMQIVQQYWARWKSLAEKLQLVDQSWEPVQEPDLEEYIDNSSITITDLAARSVLSSDDILGQRSGRIVVRGENGAGKSTMLIKLKQRFRDNAIYLPAHHNLELKNMVGSLSSGEATMEHLVDIGDSHEDVILLDEWDANLSAENRQRMDSLLDNLSRERVVIEIRHAHA